MLVAIQDDGKRLLKGGDLYYLRRLLVTRRGYGKIRMPDFRGSLALVGFTKRRGGRPFNSRLVQKKLGKGPSVISMRILMARRRPGK